MCRARADSARDARRHFRMQVRDAFSLGSFDRESAAIKESVTRAGLVQLRSRGQGVDRDRAGWRRRCAVGGAVISARRDSLFAAVSAAVSLAPPSDDRLCGLVAGELRRGTAQNFAQWARADLRYRPSVQTRVEGLHATRVRRRSVRALSARRRYRPTSSQVDDAWSSMSPCPGPPCPASRVAAHTTPTADGRRRVRHRRCIGVIRKFSSYLSRARGRARYYRAWEQQRTGPPNNESERTSAGSRCCCSR